MGLRSYNLCPMVGGGGGGGGLSLIGALVQEVVALTINFVQALFS